MSITAVAPGRVTTPRAMAPATAPTSASTVDRAAAGRSSTAPATATAVVDGAIGVVLDTLVEVERMIASLTAYRAVALNEVRQLARAAEADRPTRERGWSSEVTARRVAATEVSAALRISEREAEQLIADSAALVTDLPATLSSLRDGRVSYRHASVLVDEARSLPPSAWATFERVALPEAESRSVGGFRQKARALREQHHPESLETRRRAAAELRSVSVEPGRDGMAWLTAHLPAEQAIGAYRRLTEIAAGLGGPEESRTLSQRRADVLADLLIDGVVANSDTGRGVRATVLVSVPALSLLGTPSEHDAPAAIEGYGPISAEVARRLAAHAPSFVRLLTHPETGTVLSVGRDRYAVPRDLRLWLRIRDETCRFPGCGRAAVHSDVDHTIDWQHQGATRHDNLAHLCESHHQLKHRTDWRVNHAGGGTLEWRAPSGRRYRTDPALRLAS